MSRTSRRNSQLQPRLSQSRNRACSWMPCAIMVSSLLVIITIILGLSLVIVCISLDRGPFCTADPSQQISAAKTKFDYKWTQWAQCSTSFKCNFGDKIRYMEENNKVAAATTVTTIQSEPCNDCQQQGQWADWMEWSYCTQTCGPFGLLVRQRTCRTLQNKVIDVSKCDGMFHEAQSCGTLSACPARPTLPRNSSLSHFSWMQWSTWSSCTVSCTPPLGEERRRRQCRNTRTGNVVPDTTRCAGLSNEQRSCTNIPSCSSSRPTLPRNSSLSHFSWMQWSTWSSCTVSCTPPSGQERRRRQCGDPRTGDVVPDTTRCAGVSSEQRSCTNIPSCSSSGQTVPRNSTSIFSWMHWSTWSSCTVTCTPPSGEERRRRQCGNTRTGDVPDTTRCAGVSSEQRSCTNIPSCSSSSPTAATRVVFTWAPWTSWSSCSVTCLLPAGLMNRIQECSKQTVAINSAAKNECQAGASNSEEIACFGSSSCPTFAP